MIDSLSNTDCWSMQIPRFWSLVAGHKTAQIEPAAAYTAFTVWPAELVAADSALSDWVRSHAERPRRRRDGPAPPVSGLTSSIACWPGQGGRSGGVPMGSSGAAHHTLTTGITHTPALGRRFYFRLGPLLTAADGGGGGDGIASHHRLPLVRCAAFLRGALTSGRAVHEPPVVFVRGYEPDQVRPC